MEKLDFSRASKFAESEYYPTYTFGIFFEKEYDYLRISQKDKSDFKLKEKTLFKDFNRIHRSEVISSDNDYESVDNKYCYINKLTEIVVTIYLYTDSVVFQIAYTNCTENLEFISKIKELKNLSKDRKKNTVNLICQNEDGFYLKSYDFPLKEVNISNNYNDDFIEIDKDVKEKIKSDVSGLFLFHGNPGTGKSFYIKHLLSTDIEKQIIIIPSGIVSYLASPAFENFLSSECSNSLIIIEDAEEVLLNRKSGYAGGPINTLLNLTDGITGDLYKIQFICTFNCNKSDIDTALLRKGRLKTIYFFDLLSIEKSQKLSDSLGFETKITKKMTLADIYNQNESGDTTIVTKVGFQR